MAGSVVKRLRFLLLTRDLGLARLRTALHVLVAVIAGLAVGAWLAGLLGLPAIVGMTLGALPAFLSCLIVSDQRAGRESVRLVAFVVPLSVGLVSSIELHPFRVVELLLLVVLLGAQFYLARFGDFGKDAGAGVFGAFLCGLLLPLPSGAIGEVLLIVVSSVAVTIGLRAAIFRPDPRRALRLAGEGFAALARDVIDLTLERMSEQDGERRTRLDRRLDTALRRMQVAALLTDGLIGERGSGVRSMLARDMNRLLFDIELCIEMVARSAVSTGDAPPEARDATIAALQRVADESAANAAEVGAGLDRTLDGCAGDAAALAGPRRVAAAIAWAGRLRADWAGIDARASAPGEEVPFQSAVTIAGGSVSGGAAVFRATLDEGGLTGPWRRIRVSPETRTAIQALIAVLIVEPIGLVTGGDRYYWSVIGVLVVLAGTNSVAERVRKAGKRVLGTLIGGAIGVPLAAVLGPAHPWLALIVILLGLTVGSYFITRRYTIWAASLVVLLFQLYSLTGQLAPTTLPLRLGENVLGAVAAVVVSSLILPVGSSAVFRTGIAHVLASLVAFLDTLRDRGRVDELRFRSRAVDLDVHRLADSAAPLGGIRGGRRMRLDGVQASLASVAYLVNRIAAQPPVPRSLGEDDAAILRSAVDRIRTSTDGLREAFIDPALRHGTWTRADHPSGSAVGQPGAAGWLSRRAELLGRLDETLAEVAAAYGFAVRDPDASEVAAEERRG